MTGPLAPRDTERTGRPASPLDAVVALVRERRAMAMPLLGALADLVEGCCSLPGLVRSSALPLRSVEALVRALGDDIEPCGDGVRLRAEAAPRYRAALRLDTAARADPAAFATPGSHPLPAELLALVTDLVSRAPRAKRHLDHVSATPETVLRRALFLDARFSLPGARVLLVGDHDLTSLALAAVQPEVEIVVVDIDDDVLDHIETSAAARGWTLRSRFADLRAGLPDAVTGWADLVITDPPYTRDGVGLFAARGLEALASAPHGRLVLAYGYGDQPALGAKVEDALRGLGLVHEAIYPAFNRYEGAQAVGSASNLYVLRPTRGTGRPRGGSPPPAHLYTSGPQSIEAAHGDLARATEEALTETATASGSPLTLAVGARWSTTIRSAASVVTLAEALAQPTQQPQMPSRPAPGSVIVDLWHDPGPLLLRLLLTLDAPVVAVLVANRHPNLADEAGQRRLQRTLAAKYHLRYRRSRPSNDLAIVEAGLVDDKQLAPPQRAVRLLLERPHTMVRNVLRDALIDAARRRGEPLTKNEARAQVGPVLQGVDADATAATLSWNRLDEVLARLADLRLA